MFYVTFAAFLWIAKACDPKTSEWFKALGVFLIGGITVFLTFAIPATRTLARVTRENFKAASSETVFTPAQRPSPKPRPTRPTNMRAKNGVRPAKAAR